MLLTGLLAVLLTGLLAVLLTGLLAMLLTGIPTILLTGIPTILLATLLTNLTATLLARRPGALLRARRAGALLRIAPFLLGRGRQADESRNQTERGREKPFLHHFPLIITSFAAMLPCNSLTVTPMAKIKGGF